MLIKKETHGNFQHQLFIALFLLVMILLIGEVLADNRSDQMNPNNDAYWESRGYDGRPDDWDSEGYSDYDNNQVNQLNPNNDAIARGNNERSGDSDSSEYSDYKDNRKN